MPVAMTSLKGCCWKGVLPPLMRQRAPSTIFQHFLRYPSVVLSGEQKSNPALGLGWPKSTLPTSSEKGLSEKLMVSQMTPAS